MFWNRREHCRPICVMFNTLRSMYLFLVETEKNQCLLKKEVFMKGRLAMYCSVIAN